MTGDSEVVDSKGATIELSAGEQHNFARYVKPVFKGVLYWINPIFGKQESTR
ncbi:hypothetical protein IWW38_004455, partial [Coemansia aciculifera]